MPGGVTLYLLQSALRTVITRQLMLLTCMKGRVCCHHAGRGDPLPSGCRPLRKVNNPTSANLRTRRFLHYAGAPGMSCHA